MRGTGRGRADLPEHRRRIYDQDRCADFDELLAQAGADGKTRALRAWPDGTPLASEQDCWDLINKIRNCKAGREWTIRRGQPDGLGPQLDDAGQWTANIQVLPKDEGRAFITAKLEAGEEILYNALTPGRRSRGKYICRTAMGGCGHRHAPAPEQLCDDCASKQAGQHSRDYENALAFHQPGDANPNVLVWQVEQGHVPARSSLERKVRADYLDYLAKARAARREAEQAQQDAGQAARSIGRQLIDLWRSGRWTS